MERRVRLPAVDYRRRIGREQVGIARDAVVVGAAPEDVGVDRALREPASSSNPLSQPLSPVVPAAFSSAATPPNGATVGMRLLIASTMPPTACEPKRSAAGPRIDLDPLDRQRIDRHAVVLAEIGDVAGADAVLLHAHADIGEAAQDRAAGAGREAPRTWRPAW